jgi:hypothetical protein
MDARIQIPFLGALVNSALYLGSVFVAGIVTGNRLAWTLAIAAMGVTYLSYIVQTPRVVPREGYSYDPTPELRLPPHVLAVTMVMASILLGAFAGLSLLVF